MAYTASGGLPGWLAIPALAVEALGGLAILVGWQTRWAALALAAFTVVAAILYHYVPAQAAADPGDREVLGEVEHLPHRLAGLGAGRLSLDARQGRA